MLTKEEMQYIIDYEILVDCYDATEMSMGWYYYWQENLKFPFKVMALFINRDGSTEKNEVKITGLDSDEEKFLDMDFDLEEENSGYLYPIASSKLSNIKAPCQTMEVLKIWDFWGLIYKITTMVQESIFKAFSTANAY